MGNGNPSGPQPSMSANKATSIQSSSSFEHQIVKKDPNANINLIGYSLGGIISSYWAAEIGNTSSLKENINSITIVESPVGGIPLAGQFING